MRGGRESRAIRVACVCSKIEEGSDRPWSWVERVRVVQN